MDQAKLKVEKAKKSELEVQQKADAVTKKEEQKIKEAEKASEAEVA